MATTTKKAGTGKAAPMTFERRHVLELFKAVKVKGAAKETNEFLTERLTSLADELNEDQLQELADDNPDAHEVATAVLTAVGKGRAVLVIDDEDDETDTENEENEDALDDETDEDESDQEGDEDDVPEEETEEDSDDESESEDDEPDEESDDSDDDAEPEDEEDDVDDTPAPAPKKVAATKKPAPKPAAKPQPAGKKPPAKPAAKPAAKADKKPARPGVIQETIKLLAAAGKKNPITKKKIHDHLCKTFKDRIPAAMWSTLNAQVPTGLKTEKGIVVKSVQLPGKDGKAVTGYYIADWGGYKLPKA